MRTGESTSTGERFRAGRPIQGWSTRRTDTGPTYRGVRILRGWHSSDTVSGRHEPEVVVGLSCRPVDLAEARSSRMSCVARRIISTDSAKISKALTG